MSQLPTLALSEGDRDLVLAALARHIPSHEVWAFGSRTNGKHKHFSDLDIVVIGDLPAPLNILAALSEELSESALTCKVDIVDWATTSDSFRKLIAQHYIVLQSGR